MGITIFGYSSTVRIRVTTDSGADIGKVYRIEASAGGKTRPLRGWGGRIMTGASTVAVDHEADLSRPVTYTLLVAGAVRQTAAINVPSGGQPRITDPIRGRDAAVIIQSWPERSSESSAREIEILDAPEPLIMDGPEKAASSTLTVIHPPGSDSADALEAMLASTSVVRIRPTVTTLPTVWARVRARRRRAFSAAPGSALVDVLDIVETGQPSADTPAIGNTLQGLHGEVPANLTAISARWGDLSQIELTPGLG